ncbi:DeoR/GlpR family DNA-binding transcription regulator [Staphylococcus kloosii]|uniref:DeoR/GlpR family DNA-binding transcription regulator n=1 Tax=Staphylococcus kloosii TaxID=29384 RepID=UPI0028A4CF0F|nr:DeoR/GlpR family DNA-binding transcription regulator [Staphylococcus kloosii]MDT3958603.1 DeoR/GlpR family DNA-binding transcription regulator [Staphylococcus kloosii]
MLPAEREEKIIAFLLQHKHATIHTLSKQFNVHEATIRRDLNKLEQFDQIKRTHGGVVLNKGEVWDELSFADRQTSNYQEKVAIATKAAEFVRDNDTIIIDSGSTGLQLALALQHKRNLTLITNDIYIASTLKSTNHQVIVTGGVLHKDNYVLDGQLANNALKSFNPLKLFLSTPAIDAVKGVTHFSETLAYTKAQMVEQAQEIYILADSSKLDKVSLYNVCAPNNIDMLITDNSNSNVNWNSYRNYFKHLTRVHVSHNNN